MFVTQRFPPGQVGFADVEQHVAPVGQAGKEEPVGVYLSGELLVEVALNLFQPPWCTVLTSM